jgi:hypothetical protein
MWRLVAHRAVKPNVRVWTFELARAKALNLLVQFSAEAADLTLANDTRQHGSGTAVCRSNVCQCGPGVASQRLFRDA